MISSKSKGKVMLAISRLAADLPLHAGILSQWRIVEEGSINTMAVGFRHGRLTLYFSPAFVESITLDELTGVVEHEANHVLLGHVFHEAKPGEHKTARTVAEECSANEWVSHPLPCNPILLSAYPSLPENEDTETRCERLTAILPEDKVITLDEHAKWSEIIAAGQLAGAVVMTTIAKVWDKMTPEQRAKANLPQPLQKAVNEALLASGASVVGDGTASVPWQKVLRKYVGRALTRRPMFTRPPRRFPEMVGILPGRGRGGSKPKVLAAIDSSGSMTPAILSDISAELAVLSRTHVVTVVICDDKIRDIFPYRPITEIAGRGGTDFRPVFDPAFLRTHRPDLIVFFTDGCGPAPVDPPLGMPVIWALTPRGRKPAVWGRELWIS